MHYVHYLLAAMGGLTIMMQGLALRCVTYATEHNAVFCYNTAST